MSSKRTQTKLVSEANKVLAKLAKAPVDEVEEDDYGAFQEEHVTRFGSLHPGGGAVSLGGTPVRIK